MPFHTTNSYCHFSRIFLRLGAVQCAGLGSNYDRRTTKKGLVENRGFEPLTSSMPWKRSPN